MPRAQGCAGAADSRNRLTEQVAKDDGGNVLTRLTYTLDDTGRRVRLEEASGRVTEWQYDDLYRLTQETITDPINGNRTASYTYDKVGNRLTETVNGVTTSYSYDDNDRLTQKGSTSYSYDANGNTVSKDDGTSITSYSYDTRDKLIEADTGSQTIQYGYDINGIRTEKSAGGTTTNYVVDHNRRYAQVLAERENGTLVKSYTYGNDLVSQQSAGGQERFYIYDGLGSTRALADGSGSVTDTYAYEAFGELTGSSGSTENSYRFTGEQYDSVLDQYYLRARYYDQSVARFTQMDTWQGNPNRPTTLNKYAYATGDPANIVDPSGRFGLGRVAAATTVSQLLANSAITGFAIGRASQSKSLLPDGIFVSLTFASGTLNLNKFKFPGSVSGEVAVGGVYDIRKNEADVFLLGSASYSAIPYPTNGNVKPIPIDGAFGPIWNMNGTEDFVGSGGVGLAPTASWPLGTFPLLCRAGLLPAGPVQSFMCGTKITGSAGARFSGTFGFTGFSSGPSFATISPGPTLSTGGLSWLNEVQFKPIVEKVEEYGASLSGSNDLSSYLGKVKGL